MKTKTTDFTLQIPDAEGKIVRRVKIKVPVEWDEAIGEWMMTPEALRMVEDAKAREMGLIMPEEMKALRKSLGLTQAQIGALFQVGGKSWTRWESGKYRPNRVISLLIRAVADGHLSADYLRGKPVKASSRAAALVFSSAWSPTSRRRQRGTWKSSAPDKSALWNLLVELNPRLVSDPALTVESARRFFDIVWDTGFERGAKDMFERHREISGDSASREKTPPKRSGVKMVWESTQPA
jgi:DNA-binding transcriptional regulator YiaG